MLGGSDVHQLGVLVILYVGLSEYCCKIVCFCFFSSPPRPAGGVDQRVHKTSLDSVVSFYRCDESVIPMNKIRIYCY